jgi:hypothetical protein
MTGSKSILRQGVVDDEIGHQPQRIFFLIKNGQLFSREMPFPKRILLLSE